jgi:Leucine-rich repeat (LRR) protein
MSGSGADDLDLHGQSLTEVPVAVREMTRLRRLHLSDNELATLPAWLGELTRLQLVDAARNRITRVPEPVWMSPIDVLRLHENPLDPRAYVDQYVERFNAAVTTGDYVPFTRALAAGAVMTIESFRVEGCDAILSAYREQPPTDTLEVVSVEGAVAAGLHVPFAWHNGGTGVMTLATDQGGRVSSIQVTFD